MRKITSLLALFMMCLGTVVQAQSNQVALTFERTGTDANSVTVHVKDGSGAELSGVAANVVSSSHNFKATAGSVTEQILCPDVNANTNPQIELLLKITGLKDSESYKTFEMDIHALNGANAYQESSDGKKRLYNLIASAGADQANLTEMVNVNDIDIAAGVNTEGKTHKVWSWNSSSAVKGAAELYIKVQVSKGTENGGCFFGISGITLKGETQEVVPPAAVTKGTFSLGFQRSGTDTESVKVNVLDAAGAAISGATASVVSSTHSFKASANDLTDAILCPDANGNTQPTIELLLKVSGLKSETAYNAIEMDIHALNGGGSYQENGDKKNRQFDLNVSVGADQNALTQMVDEMGMDIADGVGTNKQTHKVWGWMTKNIVKVEGDTYIKLVIKGGAENVGCFFGISSITLKDSTAVAPPPVVTTPLAQRLGIYYYPCGQKTSAYVRTCDITGDDVVTPLDFMASSNRISAYHHVERNKTATVLRGGKFQLKYDARNINEDYVVTAYFDWDADGVYETKHDFAADRLGEAEVEVPADAKNKVRMRLRVNRSGADGADDDVNGCMYDFFIFTTNEKPVPPTGIDQAVQEEAKPQSNAAYNLEGKRISLENHRGIYIQGGQKKIK